ncbi:type III secretion system outer membrane ring subunit SctC [Vibrio harveyi]|jgi:type III secretion protein C|uniref:Type 3 secretion system secretin n=3 Tax=Vibrionaceae TaxID=641 RepID=A0ABM5Y031_VIBHA|nr:MULTISPECIES: type III secretion system outer membrane ring subunit SctC [Vibrio]AMF98953.1 EscC/YscC/HrcC family type III secretion system outer membrane ring protein [Vibrio harveyi]AWB00919.1 EscC/YscC/HrcC family type III secretion system outer membrane ring protein [Vibrio harveyi]EKO3797867.1 type III secretion system outer membrane ring subunit SctC [Vibrio harveyi]EKO3810336.1 type III secretion system outer membrane ring subunit SctC [Vibrio harveyi]EKO3816949.1 type III secretion 
MLAVLKTQMRRLVLSAVCASSLMMALPSHASELNWSDQPFRYYADNDSLKELLNNFGANYRVSVSVSDKVNDRVSGRFTPEDPAEFLDYLAQVYNLMWYFDGAVLHVYKATETRSRLLQLELLTARELRSTLISTGIWDSRYGWRAAENKGLVYLAGPPRYVDLVVQTAEALESRLVQKSNSTDELFVDIIPLKYASATDREITYRDQGVTVPGIASVLSRVLSGVQTQVKVANESDEAGASKSATVTKKASVHSGASVEAEPGLNAIIVRDTQARLPLYRKLIAQLDQPQSRIEVALSIVDISANDLSQLGVDWRAGVAVGNNSILDLKTTGDVGDGDVELGSGQTFKSLLDATNLNYLLAQIRLLESRGSAQVVSRPTLLTQENVEAVLNNSSTFYVKLIGKETAALEQVTYGTLLKIVPRIVGDRFVERPEINLSLHLEDGAQISDGDIDGVPSIRKTEISTLATVKQGQSLLIGGVYRDEISNKLRKVPLLGDIPYLGALFRSTENTTRRTVRMFIIEPRIVVDGIGDNVLIGNEYDLRPKIGTLNNISNNSADLKSALALYSCTTQVQAERYQQDLLSQGKSSLLAECELPTGQKGWRVQIKECNGSENHCVRPLEEQ